MLRLGRKYPDLFTAEGWADKIGALFDENDVGMLTAIVSLLLAMTAVNPKPFEVLQKKAIPTLGKIVVNRVCPKDYFYYSMGNPWLQVKLLRFLQYYGAPEDTTMKAKLNEILKKILASAEIAKGQTVNHKNSLNAVLFEAIQLVIHLDE